MGDIVNIFKAYDIRGAVGTELNESVAKDIGKALADILNPGKVAVGRDMRPDSGALADAVIAGLTEQGRDVIDIGQVTSDMIYFAVGNMDLSGGAMITASHNPGKDNGIKLCREGAKPIGHESGLFEIRDAVLLQNFTPPTSKPGEIVNIAIDDDWVKHVLSFVDRDRLKPMHIAVDAGNGMAGKIFPKLALHVPWKIEEMYFELDGTFPNHEANPLKFETLADLIEKIKTMGLDGGAAFDGDGDRAFLVDETGTVLTGGVMSAMMADYFLKEHPGAKIIYDVRNSRSVPKVITNAGGKPVMERVGHANIKRRMLEEDAVFGGEASGHFFFRDNWYADSGLIGAVIGLYVAGLSGKKLSELREQYTHFAAIPEINFIVDDKTSAIERLSDAFSEYDQDRMDGLTVNLGNDTWFNVRASNTEPVMRLNAESSTQARLDDLINRVKELIVS